jgi:TPR repeat protein
VKNILCGMVYIVIILFSFTAVLANDLTPAQLAYYEEEAKLDNKIAFELAQVYLNGSQGVKKDLNKAVKLFTKLANGYSSDAISGQSAYMLAVLYMGQKGHVIDHQQAENYFKSASEASTKKLLTDAPYHFAMLTQDDKLYISFLEQAALLSYVPAMVELVRAYSDKKRVSANDNALVKWLRMAANEDYVPAQALLGKMYFNGDKVYQDYEQAHYYLIRAAEHRNDEAQATIGLIYKLGLGTRVDVIKAKKWFELSYKSGNPVAGENLAGLLLVAKEKESVQRGLKILEDVASAGSKSAAQQMVVIYQEATLVEKNESKLAFWKKKHQQSKDDSSQVIGLNKSEQGETQVYKADSKAVSLYADGWQLLKDKNYRQAIPLLEQAALLDLPAAQLNLAIALIQQAQKLKDSSLYITAFAWVKIAANNKQEKASELLFDMEAAFDTKSLHDGLIEYKHIKTKIAEGLNQ